MSQDDLDYIPSIVPGRDGGPRDRRDASGERRRNTASPSRKGAPVSGSTGTLARMIAGLSLIFAALAFAWAWQLQGQLDESGEVLDDYATRIGDLEARLSDTDEGMNQNAQVQAVKIAELDSEVRKLWDNVWKQAKERLSKLEATDAQQAKTLKTVQSRQANTSSQLEEASADLQSLQSVGGDLARLMTSAKTSQAEVERVADSLNRIELSLARLEKRVAGNEEGMAAVDAFRRQVNTSIGELQGTVRNLQSAP